jgi:hypothetical protein
MSGKAGNHAGLADVEGQPSFELASDRVSLAVTRLGGHLGSAVFKLGRKKVAPLSVAPWARERLSAGLPSILRVLRGDFFCAPFGASDEPWEQEKHPPHGDSANLPWHMVSSDHTDGVARLHLLMDMRVRPGRIDKEVELRPGETNVYLRHTLSGASGPMCFGHHVMLAFPQDEGSGLVSTSRILRAQVAPEAFESPAAGGYQCLKTGAMFRSLDRVPLAAGGFADLSRYPAREGFEDIVMLTHQASDELAWTAVVFPSEGYAWFALKDPRVLRSTVLWHSNGGRHYPPWNGRHRRVLGLEDVTAYFHYGLPASARPNPVNRDGFPTALDLHPDRPLIVPYIFGVVAVSGDFGKVRNIRPTAEGIELTDTVGKRVSARVDLTHLKTTT